MRIAMIGHKRIPSREGGVERVVEELSVRLAKNNTVDVYNRSGRNIENKKIEKIRQYKGVNIYNIPTVRKKGFNALVYSFFASIVVCFKKYDILHYHAEGNCAMLWLPHIFHKKIVVTIHGLDWKRAKWGKFASKYIKFGEKLAVKYADEIIVLSENMKKYFKENYNRDTLFIPNGISQPEIRKANIIKDKYNLEKDSYILYLARIVPEKGLHYLIDAYEQIETDKKLVIAGGASDTEEYYDKIKNKVKDNPNIIMTGFVYNEELDELFSNCYLYCLPSDLEGMPISVMEAMSYGRECLVSDIPENLQVVGAHATTFKKSNVENLKEKLILCLKSEDKRKDEKIRNYILEKYNWDEVTEETLRVYNKVIKKND